jgi:hypothetical protein
VPLAHSLKERTNFPMLSVSGYWLRSPNTPIGGSHDLGGFGVNVSRS